jgi:pSer/pThr/pTyr-binding forkhead associated (FHA) protein
VFPEDPGPATAVGPTVPTLPDPPPQQGASPAAVVPMPVRNLRIGRAADNDLVLDDLLVSRYHAKLRKGQDGGLEIADLGSQNGTFVNGRRIATQPLTGSDTVGIGHSTFRLSGGGLEQFVDDGAVTVAAQELVVTVAGGKVLAAATVTGQRAAGCPGSVLAAYVGSRPNPSRYITPEARDDLRPRL